MPSTRTPQYNSAVRTMRTVRSVLTVLWCLVASAVVLGSMHAQTPADPNTEQAARAERRSRALQAEADRLAAQSRTVFGELRKLELDRAIKHEELLKAERELARVTTDRDATAKRLKTLEATRIAGTPGVSERLVELSKRGRAGYVQLLLAAHDVRTMGRRARGVAAVAELAPPRLGTDPQHLAAGTAARA